MAAISKADAVMAVSDQFMDEAKKFARKSVSVKRFYIGHSKLQAVSEKQPIFTIAYVGNLGRLYDFDTLLNVLAHDELRESVQLFVIGKGDRQNWLIKKMEARKLRYRFFGTVSIPSNWLRFSVAVMSDLMATSIRRQRFPIKPIRILPPVFQ